MWLAILGPALGLLGTVLGIWIGQRRWKHEQAEGKSASYRENLRAAYFELWDIVEEAHIRMRSSLGGGTAAEVTGFLTDVNNFMIRRGLYIERDDRFLVIEYLFWTHEFLRQTAATSAGRQAILSSMAHPDMSRSVNVLDEVRERAEDLRRRLKDRIREVVGAPPGDHARASKKPSEDLLKQLDKLTAQAKEQHRIYPPSPGSGFDWSLGEDSD